VLSIRQKSSSSASIADQIPVPESLRDAVKDSILEEVTRADSKIWSSSVNGTHHSTTNSLEKQATIHDATTYGFEDDPLDQWHLDRTTQYWPGLPPTVRSDADPFQLSQAQSDQLDQSIRLDLLGTDHPVLHQAASYFFQPNSDGGKKVRPRMVLLLSKALESTAKSTTTTSLAPPRQDLEEAQFRLAEISELIHTASLFHDDVIDESETRRGRPTVHRVFGNKVAILAGDYLLARASIALARLRQVNVVECMSTIIEHLVRGEVMQMKQDHNESSTVESRLDYYLRKNFFKTGSLMANSCQSAALLGSYPREWVAASYRYGKHLGLAFQLVDDVLDYEGSLVSMGKPPLSDLRAGLATAPVLFALERHPEQLLPLIDRKFQEEGDVERAVELVWDSEGIAKTKELAQNHAELAMEAVLEFQPGVHRDALVHLAYKVVDRTR